ncbi:MAG: type 4a pilus biogenesis protein PilO [Patescibacteria group bacterium]
MADRKDLQHSLSEFYSRPATLVTMELLLSIGLVIILGVFAIQPTLITMTELNREIEEKEQLNVQLENKIGSLQSAQSVYSSIENRLDLLDEAIPSQPELIRTLKIVELLATENDVVIESINVPRIPSEDVPDRLATLERQALPISVSVVGDYISIRAYVEELRNSRRSFVIDTVTFNLRENRGTQRLSASVTLNAPYFSE